MPKTLRGPKAGQRPPAWAGARAMAPLAVVVAPFGMVIGATVAEANVDPVAGLATAPLLYGGSAQLATVGLLAAGSSARQVPRPDRP